MPVAAAHDAATLATTLAAAAYATAATAAAAATAALFASDAAAPVASASPYARACDHATQGSADPQRRHGRVSGVRTNPDPSPNPIALTPRL